MKTQLFLSHSTRDKAIVEQFRSNLPAHFETYLDERDLRTGEDMSSTLKSAVLKSDYVIAFISSTSIQSPWVERELGWAKKHTDLLKYPFVIPVLLDPVADQVPHLSDTKYLELIRHGTREYQALTSEIVNELHASLSQRLSINRRGGDDAIYPTSTQRETGGNDRGTALTGVWTGEAMQDATETRPALSFNALLDIRIVRDRVIGQASMVSNDRMNRPIELKFVLEGEFVHQRFLRSRYDNKDSHVMQFGCIILELDALGRSLEGRYVGYGAITEKVVSGSMKLDRIRKKGGKKAIFTDSELSKAAS